MKVEEIKAKLVLGTKPKVAGEIFFLEKEKCFQDLPPDLKGKVLVCQSQISRAVLEKSRTLGIIGIVGVKIDAADWQQIEKELKTKWAPDIFAILITDQEISRKIKGKTGIIDLEKKAFLIES